MPSNKILNLFELLFQVFVLSIIWYLVINSINVGVTLGVIIYGPLAVLGTLGFVVKLIGFLKNKDTLIIKTNNLQLSLIYRVVILFVIVWAIFWS